MKIVLRQEKKTETIYSIDRNLFIITYSLLTILYKIQRLNLTYQC